MEKAGAAGADRRAGQAGRGLPISSFLCGLPSPALQSWPSRAPVILEQLYKVLELFIPWPGCLNGKATLRKEEVGFFLQEACWHRVGYGAHPASQWLFPPCSSHSRAGLSPPVWTAVGKGPGMCLPCSTHTSFDHFAPCVCCSYSNRLLLSRDVASALGSPRSFQGLDMQLQRARATRPTDQFLSTAPEKP